jgi:hypothetical protein
MRSLGKLGAVCFAAFLAAVLSAASIADDEGKEEEGAISVPIPVGKDAMGLKIPLYDQKGNLTMTLKMQRAVKIDERNLQMDGAVVQTYVQKGEPDLRISLPRSVIDLQTRMVTSKAPVAIERRDFRLTGDAIEFDLKSKKGRVMRNVKMLIYDRDNLSSEKPSQ